MKVKAHRLTAADRAEIARIVTKAHPYLNLPEQDGSEQTLVDAMLSDIARIVSDCDEPEAWGEARESRPPRHEYREQLDRLAYAVQQLGETACLFAEIDREAMLACIEKAKGALDCVPSGRPARRFEKAVIGRLADVFNSYCLDKASDTEDGVFHRLATVVMGALGVKDVPRSLIRSALSEHGKKAPDKGTL